LDETFVSLLALQACMFSVLFHLRMKMA